MKGNKLFHLLSICAIGALVLAACGGAATTEAPQPTQPPAPTVAPTQPPAPTEAVVQPTEAPAGCQDIDAFDAASAPTANAVRIAYSQEPDNLVGYYSNMTYSAWVGQMSQPGLAEWDENSEYVPDLAAEIPTVENGGISADGLTFTWHLKPNLHWSDGKCLTSADVKFTFDSIVNQKNTVLSRSGYDKIASVETPDETTIVFTFAEPYAPWQLLFTSGPNTAHPILPKHILEGLDTLDAAPEIHQPTVTAGAFVPQEWVPGDHLTLVANPNYYGGKPKLDAISIKFVPDPETALAALQTGDTDLYPDFSESDIPTLEALEPALHLGVVATPLFEHYFFNMGTVAGVDGKGKSDVDGPCPFKDLRVRKAIILATDRKGIVDALLNGKTVAPATLYPASPFENKSLEPYPYDPEQAKALLDEAGYTPGAGGIRAGKCDGKDVKLSFNFETTNKQIRVDIAIIVQQNLKDVGIEFKPIHTPAGTFFGLYSEGANMPKGTFDIAGYTTGFYPDPFSDNFLCDQIPNAENAGQGNNNYHYCDPKFDELWQAGAKETDFNKRKAIFDEIQKYMYDNALVMPMYARANIYDVSDRVQGINAGSYSYLFWNTEAWTLK